MTTLLSRIRNSPLMSQGGFALVEGLLSPQFFQSMRAEAIALMSTAVPSMNSVPDTEEVRGGRPRRSLLSSPGGGVQDAFYQSPMMLAFLREVTGLPVQPSGSRSTYSYYARPGDFLALHRDVEMCELAVLTCLYDDPYASCPGGLLRLYPHHLRDPLSVIRRSPEEGVLPVRIQPGQTIAMYGGIIPHELLPVTAGQTRIMSVLCYIV